MKKLRLFVTVLLSVVTVLAVFGTVSAKALTATETTWTVLVGGETGLDVSGAWQFLRFYPGDLTINEGDTVNFKLNSSETNSIMFIKDGADYPFYLVESGTNIIVNPQVSFTQGVTPLMGLKQSVPV